jgi:hypothetical protein
VPTVPYVSTAALRAHPTFMDLNNLRSGDSVLADQDAVLTNLLLMASTWADDEVTHPFAAHTVTENARVRPGRDGVLKWHPSEAPVRKVTGLSWGYTPGALNVVTDLTLQWIERRKQVVMPITQLGAGFSALQLGTPLGGELYTTWTYVAGYPVTTLAAAATAAASSILVGDPTGLYPGDTVRIWEPGVEEAVTVAAGYVPGTATVPLTAPLAHNHASGADTSGLPASVRLAVILYTTALLLRPDTSKEDAFPDDTRGGSTRKKDARKDGSGLVAEAVRLLASHARVR